MATQARTNPRSSHSAAHIDWRDTEEGYRPILVMPDGSEREVLWTPQPGSQRAFLECPIFECLLSGNRGGGKCLPLTEPVLTPYGWRPMGDIKVGDRVCNPDGTISTVIAAFRPGKRQIYKLTFSDGAVARCDDDHIWLGKFVAQPGKRGLSHRLYTMSQIRDKTRRCAAKFIIPLTKPIKVSGPTRNPHINFKPVDPYLLGILLGDGNVTNGVVRYSTNDPEIDAEMSKFGTVRVDKGANRRLIACPDVKKGLIQLGVWNKRAEEKRVPRAYLWGDIETRWSILQGLMDTDGTADSRGQCYFASASKGLSEDVQHLARSLGFKATIYKKETTHLDCWSVYIRGPERAKLFRLSRKKERASQPFQAWHSCRTLVSIDPEGVEEVGCFKVDNPNGLFLTRDFIVTHNSDVLLVDFLQHVGKGFGHNWRGILFRRTYPELEDIIGKSRAIFGAAWPSAIYNEAKSFWRFPDGERLYFRQFDKPRDYWKYHGQAFTWVAWEELTAWPTLEGYLAMFSCVRSPIKNIPLKVRSTTNPYGLGHNLVKKRFRLPIYGNRVVGKVIDDSRDDNGELEPPRVAIQSSLLENKVLLHADPGYISRIRAAASNSEQAKAWIKGSWDITSGGMFDDIWDKNVHVVLPFKIPDTWRIDRCFDWGSTKPFAVLWCAESDGSDIILDDGTIMRTIKGDLFVIAEWYGWNGKENQGCQMISKDIATGIKEREADLFPGRRVLPGPADSAIYDNSKGASIATGMAAKGVTFVPSDKGPGSRKNGWEKIREMLVGANPKDEDGKPRPREDLGLFFFDHLEHTLRTIPVAPRDEKDLDDVDTDSEDHIADALRYRVYRKKSIVKTTQLRGR